MTHSNSLMGNCGILEIHGLSDFRSFLDAYLPSFPIVIFSDVVERKGELIYKALVKKDIGRVYRLPERLNPNSGHYIRLYVWYPTLAYRNNL